MRKPNVIVVDQGGHGDYLSISEALSHAAPGACIIVKPGVYRDPLLITSSTEVIGEGDATDIRIEGVETQSVMISAPFVSLRNLSIVYKGEPHRDACAVAIQSGRVEAYGVNVFLEPGADGIDCSGDSRLAARECQIRGGFCGVTARDSALVTLNNCEIPYSEMNGIDVNGKAEIIAHKTRIHGSYRFGVRITGANATIEECEIYDNFRACISVNDGRVFVRSCNISGGLRCIMCLGDQGVVVVEDSEISNSVNVNLDKLSDGFDVDSGNVVARRCTVHHHKGSAASVSSKGMLLLVDCDVHANGKASTVYGKLNLIRSMIRDGLESGLELHLNGIATIEDSQISDNALSGIDVLDTANLHIRSSEIQRNKWGIAVLGTGECSIQSSTISENENAGVEISGNQNTLVDGCRITTNQVGILLEDGAVASVKNCDLTGNGVGAISVEPGCSIQADNNKE